MITADQLVLHAVGDYVIQNSWMARGKLTRWFPAVVHGVTYALPFLLLTRNVLALVIIGGTHTVLDRYRVAKYVIWFREGGPRRHPVGSTGYPPQYPEWLSTWLMIIVDNIMHIAINGAALWWTR